MNQPEVALLDQVEQRQSTIDVTTGDLDDQPQIALDHAVSCRLVAILNLTCKLLFLVGGEQRRDADFGKVQASGIVRSDSNGVTFTRVIV